MSDHHWRPAAANVKQVDTITVADTWAQNDTVVLTIGHATLTITIGTLVTVSQVATTIKEAINSTAFTDTAASVVPATGGQGEGEFREVVATSNSGVVTITGVTAGKPFTLVVSETTDGDGTATEATVTDATGQWHADNAENWLEKAVPDDDDTIFFDTGDGDCKYGLEDIGQPDLIIKSAAFTGNIGLPEINTDNAAYPYPEYRTRALTLQTNAGTTIVRINQGAGPANGLVRIDGNDANVSFYVYGGQAAANQEPQILLQGAATTTDLYVQAGTVGFGYYGESEHLDKLQVSQATQATRVIIGKGVDTANSDVDIAGGTVDLPTATGSGTIVMHDGRLNLLGSVTHAALTAWGGTVTAEGVTITTPILGRRAVLDARGHMDAMTLTDEVVLYAGATITDPLGRIVFTGGFQPTGCKLSDVNLDLGTNRSYTVS